MASLQHVMFFKRYEKSDVMLNQVFENNLEIATRMRATQRATVCSARSRRSLADVASLAASARR